MPRLTGASSRLLTTAEAADLLRVDRRTVVNWIDKRVVPFVELPGGGERHRYRIPLGGLLDSLGGTYDLAAELEALERRADEAGITDADLALALGDDH